MVAGNEFKKVVDAVVMQITDNFHGVGLHRLERLDFCFCFLVAEKEICAS